MFTILRPFGPNHIYQPISQPATVQQAGQVPYLDQNDAHEQSLGQSDGSLPGPEQTLNQSINQSIIPMDVSRLLSQPVKELDTRRKPLAGMNETVSVMFEVSLRVASTSAASGMNNACPSKPGRGQGAKSLQRKSQLLVTCPM